MKKTAVFVLIIAVLCGIIGYQWIKSNSKNLDISSVKFIESKWVNGKYDPPITITRVVKNNSASTKFIKDENWDHNVFTSWLQETLGIKLKTLWVVTEENDAFAKKLKLSISADEVLPDIIAYRGSYETLNQLLDSGRFMPIDDLFERFACPIWKDAAKKYPSMWYSVTRDGKRYGLPLLDYSMNTESVLWMREDWMESFGLQAPKTIADLEKIMDVFTNQDPDGNGKNDTYGIAVTLRTQLNTWMSDLSWLFGAYGAVNSQWNKEGDKLVYGSIQPGAKLALSKLNEWMNKGYIAREASMWDETKASELFTSGKAGIIAGPHWMPDWPLPLLTQSVPGAKYKAYPVPAGPDGKRGVRAGGSAPINGTILINKDSKHPEAYFYYYNYLLEHYANPAADSEFEYGFAEGYDYKIVDGQLVKDNPEFVSPMDYSLTYEGARIPDLMIETLAKLAREEPVTPFEKQVKAKRTVEEIEAASIVLDYDKQGIRFSNLYDGEATETTKLKGELLFQMEREAFSKMIYGQLPVNVFDEFVKQWKASGGDQMTQEVNAWYELVK
jgi:putative aldouronate transport system substrate-binding protein